MGDRKDGGLAETLIERLRSRASNALMDETADELTRLTAQRGELLSALKDVLETFSLGPLGAAAKYGPDVDVRELEQVALENALAAIENVEASS